MVRHFWECHCPAGVEEPRYLVQFLREVARHLQLLQEGKDDERALDELRSLVQRSFRPVLWGFAGKWLDRTNALAEHVGLVPVSPLDLQRVRQGLIVNVGMLSYPRVIAVLLNRPTPGGSQQVRQMLLGTCRSHSWGVAKVPTGKTHGGLDLFPRLLRHPYFSQTAGGIRNQNTGMCPKSAGSCLRRFLS